MKAIITFLALLLSTNLLAQKADCSVCWADENYYRVWNDWKNLLIEAIADGEQVLGVYNNDKSRPYYVKDEEFRLRIFTVSDAGNTVMINNELKGHYPTIDWLPSGANGYTGGIFTQTYTLGYRGDNRQPYKIIEAKGYFPDEACDNKQHSVSSHFYKICSLSWVSTTPDWTYAKLYGNNIAEFVYPCLLKYAFCVDLEVSIASTKEIMVTHIPLEYIRCWIPQEGPEDAIIWNTAYIGDLDYDPTPNDGEKLNFRPHSPLDDKPLYDASSSKPYIHTSYPAKK